MYRSSLLLGFSLMMSQFVQGQNLIVNGDFESGYSDFNSDYIQDCPDAVNPAEIGQWSAGVPNDGQFCVTEPHDWSTQLAGWHPVNGDPDNGATGKMLHVNGDVVPNSKVWCQTVRDVSPNSNYKVSTWITSLYTNGDPLIVADLQFSINGKNFGKNITADVVPGEWDLFYEIWQSGNADSAEVCIVNQFTESDGNDFILDNIGFELMDMEMPNVFVPNGDSRNDVFTPLNFDGVNNYTLRVYNRWGRKVKEISDKDMEVPKWDGKRKNSNAMCSTGMYFWTLDYEVGEGDKISQVRENGYVKLLNSVQ